MKLVLLIIIMAIHYSSFAQLPNLSAGKLERHEQFKSEYISPRHVDVWLPDNYSNKEKYAVLYMHDGQMLFDSNTTWNKQEWMVDETIGLLHKNNKIRNCIVVAIWNTEARYNEYFPQKAFDYLSDADKKQIKDTATIRYQKVFQSPDLADNYLKFIVLELKPFIDKTYAVKTDRADTFIAGSSMGGLISMYAVCEYPDIFGGAACISTHWPGIFVMENNPIPPAFLKYLRLNLPKAGNHIFYFDHGTVNLDSHYGEWQKQADELFAVKSYTIKDYNSLIFEGADHNEISWSKRLHIPLAFLLRK